MTDTMISQNIDLSSWDTLYNVIVHQVGYLHRVVPGRTVSKT